MWQDQVTHQFKKNYVFDDYIFTTPTEVNGKNTTEPKHEDEFEENFMTVHVKTISGNTISIKCDKNQKADTVSVKIEMRTAIPRGTTYLTHSGKVLNDKKAIEERNIEGETTTEM